MRQYDFSFADIVENAKDVIIVTKASPLDEPGPEIVYVNRAFTELTGYTFDEVLGQTPRILQSEKTDAETRKQIRQALERQIPIRTTIRNFSKYNQEYWLDISILPMRDDEGRVTHFFAIQRDVTEQKHLEQQLEELTRIDPLTRVYNRRAFDEILSHEYSRYRRSDRQYALLMLDIDHFKRVNDNYGHATGDRVLQAIADCCRTSLRQHDIVARLGGEEFCIVLLYTDRQEAAGVAEKLRKGIEALRIRCGRRMVSVTASFGVSVVSQNDKDCFVALKKSDAKLYEAKNSGRNRVCD